VYILAGVSTFIPQPPFPLCRESRYRKESIVIKNKRNSVETSKPTKNPNNYEYRTSSFWCSSRDSLDARPTRGYLFPPEQWEWDKRCWAKVVCKCRRQISSARSRRPPTLSKGWENNPEKKKISFNILRRMFNIWD
jgi:hypothetical protein